MAPGHPLPPVPEHDNVYETSLRFAGSEIDEDYRLRLDSVARFLEIVGLEHLEDANAFETHPHWIVRRTVIDVVRPIKFPEVVTLQRWCSGVSPRWCTMRVRLVGSDGGLVETEAFWINMNMETKGPSRFTDYFFDYLGATTTEHRLRWRPWLTDNRSDEPGVAFPLRRTDLDHFEHINNTAYWHGVQQSLAESPSTTESSYRAVVEYVKAITWGDEVLIHSRSADDAVEMTFSVDDDVRALVHVGPL